MSDFQVTNRSWVITGDYIRVIRKGYGIREGVLGEFRGQENGEWTWPDQNGNPLLDPWWAAEGTIYVRKAA